MTEERATMDAQQWPLRFGTDRDPRPSTQRRRHFLLEYVRASGPTLRNSQKRINQLLINITQPGFGQEASHCFKCQ